MNDVSAEKGGTPDIHRFGAVSRLKNYLYDKFYPFERRVRITSSCRDTDYIPKVENAGEVTDGLQVMHNGLKFPAGCYAGDWMIDLIKNLKGHHEPQEEKAFYELLKVMEPGSTIVELGSYWAYYSLWFSKAVENAKAYLIEPEAEQLQIGLKNFEINGFPEPPHLCRGVSNETDESKGLINIDDFVEAQGIETIDILHSDIQGYEVDMLEGAKKTIEAGKIRYAVISTHRGKHKPTLEMLKKYDFHIIVEHPLHESYSYEGLVVARPRAMEGIDAIEVSRREKRFIV